MKGNEATKRVERVRGEARDSRYGGQGRASREGNILLRALKRSHEIISGRVLNTGNSSTKS